MSADELTAELILERLLRDGVRRTVTALRKPPVPSRLLQELADLAEPTIAQQFVAAYPLSPSHLLETLARTAQDPEVFPFLATNPRTPPHLLSEFAAHENPEVRAHVATHPQLAARELLNLAQDNHAIVRRAVASNSAIRLPHYAALVADTQPSVRLRIASQSALPAEVALVLAADASTVVRAHTIAASTASEELILGWAASDEEEVQLAIAARPDLPAAAIRLLLLSNFPSVRRVARALVEPDTVELLHFITIGEPEERAWVAARPALPSPLQRQLAQDEDATVRLALAANPALDPDVIDYFLTLGDEAVCVALATNPALTSDHVQALAATRLPAVLTALAYRETLYDELVPFLLEHSPEFLRHWAIQPRPATITDQELARRLLTDPLPSIRALAVTSYAWRRADLYEFARDPAAIVRLAAINHPQASDELINDGLLDPAPEVAAAAQAAQAARLARAQATPTRRTAAPFPLSSESESTEPEADSFEPAAAENPRARAAHTDKTPGLFKQLKRLFWQ
jgi:hypothetical protein